MGLMEGKQARQTLVLEGQTLDSIVILEPCGYWRTKVFEIGRLYLPGNEACRRVGVVAGLARCQKRKEGSDVL